MTNHSQPELAGFRYWADCPGYWATLACIRLLLLTPMAISIVVIVAGVRADSTGAVLGGIFLVAIGFMIAGTKVTVAGPMDIEQGENNGPVFRSNFSAASPNGLLTASMPEAEELGMGNPWFGELRLSDGLSVEDCSPSFVWSDDSRYLAVPQIARASGFFGHSISVRLLVIDTRDRMIFRSRRFKAWLQPMAFSSGQLVVRIHAADKSDRTTWSIPGALRSLTRFTYEQIASPGTTPAPFAGVRRLWPLFLGVCWCTGMFLKQLMPLEHQEVLYQDTQYGFASWLMIVLPLFLIFWLCVTDKPARIKRGDLDRSTELGFALIAGWVVLMVSVSFGAIRLGYEADKAGAGERLHSLVVSGKQKYEKPREFLKRRSIARHYVSTRLHDELVEFQVDQHMYSKLNLGDGINVSEVTGKSGRQYMTLLD